MTINLKKIGNRIITKNIYKNIYYIVFISCIVFFLFLIVLFLKKNYTNKHLEFFDNNTKNILDNTSIYIINLDKDKDRWNTYTNLNIPNIQLNRYTGVYGKNVNRQKLITDGILDKDNVLKDGQLGCALSHINLWKDFYESENKDKDKKYLLVLEDDVIINKNIYNDIGELSAYFPSEWDIIFFGGCNIYGKKINERFIVPTKFDSSYNLCLHAMLINKNSIPKLINVMTPLQYPIDNQLRDKFPELSVFYSYPNLINQNKDLLSSRRIIDGSPQSEYWKKNHTNITIV